MPRESLYDDGEDDRGIGDNSEAVYKVTAGELRQFVERWERLDVERRDIVEAQKDVMAEARARGYLVKAVKALIKERTADPDELSEFQSILDVYREALGM